MSKQKVTNTTQITTGVEKEKNESSRCRETIAAIYAAQAEQIFVGVACKTFHKTDTQLVSEEEVRNILNKVYCRDNTCVLIYTQPSEECNVTEEMRIVGGKWNNLLPIGQRWYVKQAPVMDAFVLLRAYSNYLRFTADHDKALQRNAKKIIANMSNEELMKFIMEQQKAQTDNND